MAWQIWMNWQKGWKALGNKMSDQKLMHVAFVSPESEDVTDLFSES
jgi:hypothetical protein